MNWDTIIDNLNDLIEHKNTKINGLCLAIDMLKDKNKKCLREVRYLKSKYNDPECLRILDEVIELMETLF